MIKLCVCVCVCRPVTLSHVNMYASFTTQQAFDGLLNLLWKTESGIEFSQTTLKVFFFCRNRSRNVTIRCRKYDMTNVNEGENISILLPLLQEKEV